MALNKAEILSAMDRKPQIVAVDGLGEVLIVPMSGKQRQQWSRDVADASKLDDYYARVVTLCVVDEAGKPMFTDAEASTLADGNGKILQSLVVAVLTVSGLWEGAVDAAKKN